MSQLCRACDKPAKIVDSRTIDKNVTRRRYHCQNAKCLDKWTTIEMITGDGVQYQTMKREMSSAAKTVMALKKARDILNKAMPPSTSERKWKP